MHNGTEQGGPGRRRVSSTVQNIQSKIWHNKTIRYNFCYFLLIVEYFTA